MPYPLISEYVEAIRSAEDNFDKLSHLRPVLDSNGRPVMSSGNFAVVFKMSDGNRFYALKCFLKDQESCDEAYRQILEELKFVSSPYLVGIAYHERELFVDSRNCSDTEFPVLLMDWVEGVPLDRYLTAYIHDTDTLKLLAYRFGRLATWLLTQPFAHGDIKPDNILVTPGDELILVDYDGMFVPAMNGQHSRELGSPDFRHPLRTPEKFNEHIDDFALTSIALSLKAIALDSSLLSRYGAADRLLFSHLDYQNPARSETLKALTALFYDHELTRLYALFLLAHTEQSLSAVSFRLFNITKPRIEEYKEGELIVIPDGTQEILPNAYRNNTKVKCVRIPDSVTTIGFGAFHGCTALQTINIPNSVIKIKLKKAEKAPKTNWLEITKQEVSTSNTAENTTTNVLTSNEFSYSIDSNMLMKAMQRFRIRMLRDKSKSFYNAWKVTKVKVEMINDGPIPWPRMSISLAAPIKALVFNKETQEYETGESSVIYVSAWQVLNVLQNDPFFAAYVDKMREDFSLLELAMSMADIWIAQEYIAAGEQSRDVITDRERKKVYDHDTIINTILKIEPDNLAKRNAQTFTFAHYTAPKSITPQDSAPINNIAFLGCTALQTINVPHGSKNKFIGLLGQEYADKIKEIDL